MSSSAIRSSSEEVAGLALDVGAAWVREEALHLAQLVLDHVERSPPS